MSGSIACTQCINAACPTDVARNLVCMSVCPHGVSNNLLQQMQSVQNAAACLITGTRRCGHITPVLQKLHWLPVCRFKLSCLVHQLLAGQTPAYLASDIQLIAETGRPQLRSASKRICVVPCSYTHNSFGDRRFSVAGPRVWMAVPSYMW